MIKKFLPFLCSFFILLTFGSFRPNDHTYVIKMRLRKGDSFEHHGKMNMNISTTGMNIKIDMDMGCIFEVVDADSSSKSLKMTYTSAHMSMDMNNPNMPSHLADSIMNVVAAKIVGKSITLKLSNTNEITDVTGYESFMSDLTTDDATKAKMQGFFSKDYLNSTFGMMFKMYPENPVKIGDSWNTPADVTMNNLNMKVNIRYTLQDVKDDIATIAVDGVIEGKGNVNGNTSIEMDMNGTDKGAFTVSLSDGYMKTGVYTMAINGSMNTGGQKIPLTMQADYNMTGK